MKQGVSLEEQLSGNSLESPGRSFNYPKIKDSAFCPGPNWPTLQRHPVLEHYHNFHSVDQEKHAESLGYGLL